MTELPVFFAKPSSNVMPLAVQPRLASWMAAGPDQVRLEEFVAHAEPYSRRSCRA